MFGKQMYVVFYLGEELYILFYTGMMLRWYLK